MPKEVYDVRLLSLTGDYTNYLGQGGLSGAVVGEMAILQQLSITA
jgi:hypothetical protein